jgi:hypothetical protein
MLITKHVLTRSQQRGIPRSIVELILQYGEPKNAPGNAYKYEVAGKTIPQLQSHLKGLLQEVEKLRDKVVVVSDDGCIITVYHK